jgi:hypothetical protein
MLVAAALLIAAVVGPGCGGAAHNGGTATATVVEEPRTAQTPTPVSTTVSVPALSSLLELPLSALSPEAARYLEGRRGPVGVAVVVPSRGAVYTWNGHEMLHMASVAKVGIMLTLMDQAMKQGRDLTEAEIAMLTPMITVSDNASATQLWNQVGGGQGAEDYFRSIGLTEINPNKESCWGASYASAHDVAMLFAKLAFGEVLDERLRAVAIGLLQAVDPSQTWGVTAAAPEDRPEGTIVGVKDGWYPADCGWWVNSAGMIVPADDKPAYTIAVLTGEQVTWEYGIETIETVGSFVHAALH